MVDQLHLYHLARLVRRRVGSDWPPADVEQERIIREFSAHASPAAVIELIDRVNELEAALEQAFPLLSDAADVLKLGVTRPNQE